MSLLLSEQEQEPPPNVVRKSLVTLANATGLINRGAIRFGDQAGRGGRLSRLLFPMFVPKH